MWTMSGGSRGVTLLTSFLLLRFSSSLLSTRELPNAVPAAIAITGSMIAGIATVEALFRAHR